MKLSDDIGPPLSGPGSPGPRRRWGRKKTTLAAALALTAVTGVAGLTQATSASAATRPPIGVFVSAADANNWGAGWDKAWNKCRLYYPSTKSVEFLGSQLAGNGAVQAWKCRDTP